MFGRHLLQTMNKNLVFVLTLIVLFPLLFATPYIRLRTLDNSSQLRLTNDEKVAIKNFRAARKSLSRMTSKSKSELKQRSEEFRDWNDQKLTRNAHEIDTAPHIQGELDSLTDTESL